MRVVFLDIDGVLNSHKWFSVRGRPSTFQSMYERSIWDLDPSAVNLMKGFVERNNLKVVISSSWRILYNKQEIKEMLQATGWKAPIVGTTPYIKGFRGDEIDTWRRESLHVDTYIIFDDDGDFNPHQRPFFVQTSFETGLTEAHVEQAQQILTKQR